MSFLKVIAVGNLGADPELRYTPEGQAVTNFPMAVNRNWTGRDGEPRTKTTWLRVSIWGKQAEACNQYLGKGRQVLVEGELQADQETGGPRVWTRQDGSPGANYELRAFQVQFLGGRNDSDQDAEPAPASEPLAEDDIPF